MSAESTKSGRAREGYHSILELGGLPRDFFLIFSTSIFVLMGFDAFGTKLQSLSVMFFFLLEKIFLME